MILGGFWRNATLFLTLALALRAVPPCDNTPNPCFTNVKDVLKDQRLLLLQSDIFLPFESSANGQFGYGNQVFTTSQLALSAPATNTAGSSPCSAGLQARPARLFAGSHQALVSVAPSSTAQNCGGNNNIAIYVSVIGNPAASSTTLFTSSANSLQVAVADFARTGFDQVLVLNDKAITTFGAKDPSNPAAGLVQLFQLPYDAKYAPGNGPATGDFNGDGAVDLAWPTSGSGTWLVNFASVCPTDLTGAPSLCSQPNQVVLSSVTIGVAPPGQEIALANAPSLISGRFKGISGQAELVIGRKVLDYVNSNFNTQVLAYDFDASLNPTNRSTYTWGENINNGPVLMAAGPLSAISPSDQLVYTNWELGLGVIVFNSDLTIASNSIVPTADSNSYSIPISVAIGRFDPPNLTDGSTDFTLQIAVIETNTRFDNNSGVTRLSIYRFTPPQGTTPTLVSRTTLANSKIYSDDYVPYGSLLWTGDLQGRSLVLGAPNKVTITGHIQPDLVLAIPPMHIDYIRDVDNLGPAGSPSVLNLTVMPSLPAPATAFSTQYAFASTASTSTSSSSTTSYGYSVGGSSDQKVTAGNPKTSFVSTELKEGGKSSYNNSVATNDSSYQAVTNSLNATTGFSDHLFFTESRMNIYYYQVMGQFKCPDAIPNCTDAQKQPVMVQYSGPDLIEKSDIDATTQEWYQPIHEPGNIFSYPWNLGMLQADNPLLIPLTDDPAPWRSTDTSTTSYSTNWKGGAGSSKTTGSVTSHSFDFSTTVTGQIQGGIPLLFTVTGKITGEFDYSHSDSVSTMNSSATTIDASTGIQVNKPEFTDKVAQTYPYQFAGYVLGVNPPNQYDAKSLKDSGGKPVDLQVGGPMTVAFLADPTRSGAPWWQQAYSRPDVGLNHPARWSWSKSQQLATFNAPDLRALPQDQPFYQMKGLYISTADANGLGPQRSTATAGEKLQIRARVYNYSLADMPSNAKVHVRFYGQVFENALLQGDAFLIGDSVIGPIPGFNSNSVQGTKPNWSFASVNFDTTNYPDKHLAFWVVVWMDDGANLIPELEGHGLTVSPATLTFKQITDVPIQPYSNNVGLYGIYSPFYVAAQGAPLGAFAGTSITKVGIETVSWGHVSTLIVDRPAKLFVTVRNPDMTPLDHVPVAFYLGNPATGGKLFDLQRISRLRPNSKHIIRTLYRPETAGPQELWVRVGRADAEPAMSSTRVTAVTALR